jgi:hypothetical protein
LLLVHITSLAPSISNLALRRQFVLPSPSRWSGGNWPVVVLAAPRHQHEDNARDLVGERDRSQLERMRESCKSGSVGEAVGDRRLYPTASNPV